MKETDTQREQRIYKITLWGSLCNFLLLVFKFIAGFVGNSSAMIADAVHSLSDFITDLVVILFVRISGKPEDENHDYGHGKYETLGTVLIGALLLLVGAGIFINATGSIVRVLLWREQLEAPGLIALSGAMVSIVVKETLFRYTIHWGRRLRSMAVTANAWHHRSDALSSIGTLAGVGGALLLGPDWRILDPLAALVVSVFIVREALHLSRPCIEELLERSLPPEEEKKIMQLILASPEVSSPHHLRTRHIGNSIAISVHVRMDGNMTLNEAHEVTRDIEQRLKAEFGDSTFIGIHMEPRKPTQQRKGTKAQKHENSTGTSLLKR